jgi:hypothetical protein
MTVGGRIMETCSGVQAKRSECKPGSQADSVTVLDDPGSLTDNV